MEQIIKPLIPTLVHAGICLSVCLSTVLLSHSRIHFITNSSKKTKNQKVRTTSFGLHWTTSTPTMTQTLHKIGANIGIFQTKEEIHKTAISWSHRTGSLHH